MDSDRIRRMVEDLDQLALPCPPMLDTALGCPGEARLVGYQYRDSSHGVAWYDGWFIHTPMDLDAWHLLVDAPAFRFALPARVSPEDLGTPWRTPTHMLLMDRHRLTLYVGPTRDVEKVLKRQHGRSRTLADSRAYDEFLRTYVELNALAQPVAIIELRQWIKEHFDVTDGSE